MTYKAVAEVVSQEVPGRVGRLALLISASAQAGAKLKVNILDSPAVSRCLESIDFLLCKLDSHCWPTSGQFQTHESILWRSQP